MHVSKRRVLSLARRHSLTVLDAGHTITLLTPCNRVFVRGGHELSLTVFLYSREGAWDLLSTADLRTQPCTDSPCPFCSDGPGLPAGVSPSHVVYAPPISVPSPALPPLRNPYGPRRDVPPGSIIDLRS